MAKKNALFIFGLILFFAFSASAMNEASPRHMSMHNDMLASVTTHHSDKANVITDKTARERMTLYMDTQSQAGYHLDNFRDKGKYYIADVISPKGELLNRLVVNKKTGNVYFAKK